MRGISPDVMAFYLGSRVERYVLIRPGALGDALLALPVLALLRRDRPGAHLTLVARGDVLPLARASALADTTCDWASAAWAALFAEDARAGAADEVRALIKGAAVVAWLTDADGMVARSLAAWGARQVVIAPGRPPVHDLPGDAAARDHVALLLARALVALRGHTVPATAAALAACMAPLHVDASDDSTAERVWHAFDLPSRRVVALHAGSGGATKRWPAPHFAELTRRLVAAGWRPLLIEGPADLEATASVLAALGPLAHVVPVARGLAVGALAALLRRCAGYAGNDSGVSHLAALAGVPTLALFGPSDPARWAPLGPRVRILRAPNGDLAAQDVDAVWEALWGILGLIQ